MKVSIIIPIYNVADYITDCIQSVINQTYTGDLECILVNDCTPDNSLDLVDHLLKEYVGTIQFRIVNREKNGGLSAARNSGIEAATGDYYYFLDSDDMITPDCISSLIEVATKYPKADIVQASARTSTGQGFNFLRIDKNNDLPSYSEDLCWIKSTMLKRYVLPMTVWNKLIKRSFLLTNNLYFKEGLLHEDEHWNFFAAKYTTAIAICKQITYIYRIRENSIVTSINNKEKSQRDVAIILQECLNHLDKLCRSSQVRMIFELCYEEYVEVEKKSLKWLYRRMFLKIGKKLNPLGWFLIAGMLVLPHSVLSHDFVARQINVRLLTVSLLGVNKTNYCANE